MVRVPSPGGGESSVAVDIGLVRAAVRDGMAAYTSIGIIPSQLDRMADGDLSWPARRLTERGWCLGSDLGCADQSGWSGGGEFANDCLRRPSSGPADVDRDPLAVVCGAWFDGRSDEPGGTPISSDVPIVTFLGQIDVSTSATRAQDEIQALGRATVVEIPWAPEGAEFACLGSAAAGWLEHPRQLGSVSCPAIGSPEFADAP
jgi:hypothetical protein